MNGTVLVIGLGACTWWSDTGYRQDPGAAQVSAIPLATCRNQGAAGNACIPTPSEIGTSPVHPCRERSGKCGPVGGRMMCVLDRIADGKQCQGTAGTCAAGECVAAGGQRDGG